MSMYIVWRWRVRCLTMSNEHQELFLLSLSFESSFPHIFAISFSTKNTVIFYKSSKQSRSCIMRHSLGPVWPWAKAQGWTNPNECLVMYDLKKICQEVLQWEATTFMEVFTLWINHVAMFCLSIGKPPPNKRLSSEFWPASFHLVVCFTVRTDRHIACVKRIYQEERNHQR